MSKADKSFETLLEELEQVVQRLETEQISLDEAMELHGRAVALVKTCQTRLQDAEQRIEKIVQAEDGFTTIEPLETAQ